MDSRKELKVKSNLTRSKLLRKKKLSENSTNEKMIHETNLNFLIFNINKLQNKWNKSKINWSKNHKITKEIITKIFEEKLICYNKNFYKLHKK